MYTPIPPQPTNAQAWLAAASAVQDAGGEAYNVVIDIADPLAVMGPDVAILTTVDQFLREHHVNTLSGVANTIFPQGLLDRHGADGLYAGYNKVLPRMKKMTHDWGRYFERMTAWKKVKGKDVIIINPLDELIRFMRAQIDSDRTYRNTYEMTIYDPTRDAGKVSNRQCLSFLSFKLTQRQGAVAHCHISQSCLYSARAWKLSRSREAPGVCCGSVRSQAGIADMHLDPCRN